jgi:hypothetical protein
LVKLYGTLVVEDLKVQGLARSMLAKSVNDAGWAQFLRILALKAEEAGRVFLRVAPAGTTQRCSGCAELVAKSLHERSHACTACGLRLDRDENAARNILQLAQGPDGAFRRKRWGLPEPLPEKPSVGLAESSRTGCSSSRPRPSALSKSARNYVENALEDTKGLGPASRPESGQYAAVVLLVGPNNRLEGGGIADREIR